MSDELMDVTVRVPKEFESKIAALGAQCGLTADQMASAMFVLAMRNWDNPITVDEEETHL